jgi:hypothetical protein
VGVQVFTIAKLHAGFLYITEKMSIRMVGGVAANHERKIRKSVILNGVKDLKAK